MPSQPTDPAASAALAAAAPPLLAQTPPAQQGLGDAIRSAAEAGRAVWEFEIASVSQEPLTVGTIVLAVALLAIGYWISGRLSRWLTAVLIARFRLEAGSVSAIRTLASYTLFAIFAFTSLALVNFPLTAFTIAGGALAIGVGFGSQNVMNNFISGLILNVERPVRVGDFVQVSDTTGTIERIGARSTLIRASNNTQMIVPNSFLLENPVVNFTLTDDVIRSQISLGVVYGSPTREVARLVLQALGEHPRILPDFKPRVVFEDFGDNALIFQAYFWVRARSILEQREIQSDLRFRIDELFRAAGIVIAFPQRDVHLDSQRPVEVRIVKDPDRAVP